MALIDNLHAVLHDDVIAHDVDADLVDDDDPFELVTRFRAMRSRWVRCDVSYHCRSRTCVA
jgi:hypothetical protein